MDLEYDVAPMRGQEIYEMIRLVERMSSAYYKVLDKKANDQIEETGIKMSDDIYYMLLPENIKNITQKKTHRSAAVDNALSVAANIQKYRVTPIAGQQVKTLQAMTAFRMAMKKNDLSDHFVTSFDFETYSGISRDGQRRIRGIYDFSFRKLNSLGQQEVYGGLIGIQNQNDLDMLNDIASKIKKGERLTKEENVVYEFFSRVGANTDQIKDMGNGRFVMENAPVSDIRKFKTYENLTKGIRELQRIGQAQGATTLASGAVLHNGYKQLLDTMAETLTQNTIVVGHNIRQFDIDKFKTIIDTIPGAKEYLASKGTSFEKMLGSEALIYDTYDVYNFQQQQVKDRLNQSIYSRRLGRALDQLGNRRLGSGQLEALVMGLAPEDYDMSLFDTHHVGNVDTLQPLQILGLVAYDNGKYARGTTGDSSVFETLEKALLDRAQDQAEYVYNEKNPILVQALNGINLNRQEDYIFGMVQQGNEFYFSDGTRIDSEGTLTRNNRKFVPGLLRKDAIYSINPSSIRLYKAGELSGLSDIKERFGADENIVSLTFNAYSKTDYNRDDYTTTIFMSESKLGDFFQKNLGVLRMNGEWTKTAQTLLDSAYTVSDGKINPVEEIKDLTSYSTENRIADNFSRRIREGSYSSAAYGLAMRDLYEAVDKIDPGKYTLDQITNAIKTIATTGDTTEFNRIVGGRDLISILPSTKYKIHFDQGKISYIDDITKASSWLNQFKVKNIFNTGWFDNSVYSARNFNTSSFMAQVLRRANTNDDINSSVLLNLMNNYMVGQYSQANSLFDRRRALGYTRIQPSYNTSIFSIELPKFLNYRSGRGKDLGTAFLDLDLNSVDRSMAALRKAMPQESDFRLRSSQGIYRDEENLAIGYRERYTQDIITSSAFQNVEPEAKVDEIIEDAIQKYKDQPNFNQGLMEWMGGTEKDENEFLNQIANLDNKDAGTVELYKQRKALFELQQKGVQTHTDHILKILKDNGGQYRISSNNRLYISFGGVEQDVTHLMPRLRSNGGVIRHLIGDSMWDTDFSINAIRMDGSYNVRSNLEVLSNRYFRDYNGTGSTFERKMREAALTGNRSKMDVFLFWLGQVNKGLRENENLMSTREVGLRNNTHLDLANLMTNRYGRDKLATYLNDQLKYGSLSTTATDSAQRVLNWLNTSKQDENGDYFIPNDIGNAFRRLLDENVVQTQFELNGVQFNLNVLTKDSNEQKLRYSMSETFTGVNAFQNPSRGTGFVEQRTVRFNANTVNENAQKDIGRNINEYKDKNGNVTPMSYVKTEFEDAMGNIDNGIEIGNRIAVARKETYTQTRDEILKVLYEHTKNLEVVRRLGLKINTFEGGAYISGRLIRSLGYVPGTRRIKFGTRELLDTDRMKDLKFHFTSNSEDGRPIKFSYGKGYIVGRGDNIFDSLSYWTGEEEENRAKKLSRVQSLYYTQGDNLLLSEQQVNDYIYNWASTHNVQIKTAEDFQRVADQILTKQITATPLAYQGPIKVLTGVEEKHISQYYIGTLRDTLDYNREMGYFGEGQKEKIEAVLNAKVFQSFRRKYGEDLLDLRLSDDTFNQIVSGQNLAQSALFKDLDKNEVRELEDAINAMGRITVQNAQGVNEERNLFQHFAILAREEPDKILEDVTGAQMLSKDLVESGKHGYHGTQLERAFNSIKWKAMTEGKTIEEATQIALEKIQGNIFNTDGAPVRLRTDSSGNLIIPAHANLSFNIKELRKIVDENTGGLGQVYKDTIRIIDDAADFSKKAKFGSRELNSLLNTVYDEDILNLVRERMGNNEQFSGLFGEILDDQDRVTDRRAIWTDSVNRILSDNLGFGLEGDTDKSETLFNPNGKKVTDAERDIYNTLKQQYGEDAPISKEHVKRFYQYRSSARALELNNDLNRIPGSKKEWLQDFTNQKDIRDLSPSIRGVGRVIRNDKTNIWTNNTAINLVDDSIGITEDYLKENHLNSTFYLPGAGDDIFYGDQPVLKGYQNKFNSVLADYEELRQLSREKDPSNPEVAARMDALRDNIVVKLHGVNEELNRYTGGIKEGQIGYEMANRRYFGSAQSKINIFDVNSLIYRDDAKEILPMFSDITYNGENLADIYRSNFESLSNGGKIQRAPGFMITSTRNLAKYGFDDQYFENLYRNSIKGAKDLSKEDFQKGVSEFKTKWLQRAKTEGVRALGNRAPSDYFGSTRAIQLYFSDDVDEGMTLVDNITAALMKADADGDTVRSFILGARSTSGQFMDLLSVNMLRNRNDAQINNRVLTTSEQLERTYNRQTAIDSYYQNAEMYNIGKSYKEYNMTDNEYQKAIREAYDKQVQTRAINGLLQAYNPEFVSGPEARALEATWNAGQQTMADVIANAGISEADRKVFSVKWNSSTEASQYLQLMDVLNANPKGNDLTSQLANSLTDDQRNSLYKAAQAWQRRNDALVSSINRGLRPGTGEMDTSLYIVDMMSNYLNTAPEVPVQLRLSQNDINALNYVRESVKEGFLTPKHGDAHILERDRMSALFKEDMDVFFRGGKDADEAKTRLTDMFISGGRDVTGRNIAASDIFDISNKDHAVLIQRGFDVMQRVRDSIKPAYRKNLGMMKNTFSALTYNNMLRTGAANPNARLQRAAGAVLGFSDVVQDQIFRIQRETKDNLQKMASDNMKAEAIRTAQNNFDATSYLASLPRKMTQLPSHWGTMGISLAAGLMMAGYAGGSPVEPVGNEANAANQQQPQEIQEMPAYTDASLPALRGGPRQGYIININAQTRDNADYAAEVISQAVRNQYSNTQVNIALNVQDQSRNITSEDLLDYFFNSI